MPGLLELSLPENWPQKMLVIIRQQVMMKMKILRTRTALTLAASTAGRATRTMAILATTIPRHERLTIQRRNLAKEQAAVLLLLWDGTSQMKR